MCVYVYSAVPQKKLPASASTWKQVGGGVNPDQCVYVYMYMYIHI